MIENSPTCILNSVYLQGPPTGHPSHRPLVTISSEVDSSASAKSSTASGAAAPCCEQQQIQQNPGGVPLLSNNRCSCCLINTLSPPATEHETELLNSGLLCVSTNHKGLIRAKSSSWKASKFFSKSMNSGEILKGLRKLSLSSNTEDQDSSSSSKSLKSKLNFKKRSSCGNEEVPVDIEALEKLSKSAPVPVTPTNKTSSDKTLQDDGIVCKKEDLKAIICSATKRFPLCSPSRKKNALRQTKSTSFEPPQEQQKKEPVRRAGSEESRTRKSSSVESKDPPPSPKVVEVKSPCISNKPPPIVVAIAAPPPVIVTKVQEGEPVELQVKVEDATGAVSTVKWDETNVVDAVLIGDAIESFLKGSMTSSEKKVAFRKNSYEKKKS